MMRIVIERLLNLMVFGVTYSVTTNFRPELKEPAAREIFIFWTLFEREERSATEERRREHGSNLSRLEKTSELKKNF